LIEIYGRRIRAKPHHAESEHQKFPHAEYSHNAHSMQLAESNVCLSK
jgi:hypothetical protein